MDLIKKKSFVVDYTPAPIFHLKKPVLWLDDGKKLTKLASFNNKKTAKQFCEAVEEMYEDGISLGETGIDKDY